MKITHNKVGQNLNIKDTGKGTQAGKTDQSATATSGSSAGKADALMSSDLGASKVNLSNRAQDMKKAKEIAKDTPDIREDKVAKLQAMIDKGEYKVDAKAIADKMVDEEAQWMP